jgi:hypothetical protein
MVHHLSRALLEWKDRPCAQSKGFFLAMRFRLGLMFSCNIGGAPMVRRSLLQEVASPNPGRTRCAQQGRDDLHSIETLEQSTRAMGLGRNGTPGRRVFDERLVVLARRLRLDAGGSGKGNA